jgi:hypothetical protein
MTKLRTFNSFNKTAHNWLADLEKKSEEEILLNPYKGSWSISELYDHIIRVARSYQIPNLKISLTAKAHRKKSKNVKGIVVFNLGIKKLPIKIEMESFPEPLVDNFTPIKQNKSDLIKDFKLFIEEVNNLKEILLNSSCKNKHYHPMFGDISTKDWFTIIVFHLAHHEKQKDNINKFLEYRQYNIKVQA